jgi:glycosyltransferase involved in cell wall biosynthesis
MKEKRRLLVLYSELMPYNLSVFQSLIGAHEDVEIDVVCWNKKKKLTPFLAVEFGGLKITDIDELDLNYLNNQFYRCVYVAGRMERVYLEISKHYKGMGTPVVMASDEQLVFSLKQFIKKIFSRRLYHQYFTHYMAAGFKQYEMARWLGFDTNKIFKSACCCSVIINNNTFVNKKRIYNKEFIVCFIGRFVPEKGLLELVRVIEHLNSLGYEISLKCIGQGPLWELINEKPFVRCIDFCSPDVYFELTEDVRFLVLPSFYEPWGVVVHESMSLGLPVLVSENVGAGYDFVKHRVNGLIFNHSAQYNLTSALKEAYGITEDDWKEMCVNAFKVSSYHVESNWATVINSLMNESHNN